MLELKYVILQIKIYCEGLLAECRRQMKMSKNLMTYKQNREKKDKRKNRAAKVCRTMSKSLTFITLESQKERGNEIGSE